MPQQSSSGPSERIGSSLSIKLLRSKSYKASKSDYRQGITQRDRLISRLSAENNKLITKLRRAEFRIDALLQSLQRISR